MRIRLLTFMILAAPVAASAQEIPSAMQGRWTGTMGGFRGGDATIELKIDPKTSSMRVASSVATKYDTCVNKSFPAEVVSTAEDTIKVSVQGDGVIRGCERFAELKNTSPGVLEGKVGTREVRLTRE